MWVLTWECLKRMMIRSLGSDTTTAAPFSGAVLGLLKDAYAPTAASVYAADVQTHEANFDGYLKKSIAGWNTPYRGQNTFELGDSTTTAQFTPTGSTTINTITGQFLLTSDSVTLLGVEMFNAPIPLPGSSYSLVTVVIVGLNTLAGYGNSLVSN